MQEEEGIRVHRRVKSGMQVRLGAMLVAMAATLVTGVAHADAGVVIWKNFDCGFFVVQAKSGYGLLEWISGPFPNSSDVIEGEFSSAGEHRMHNTTADLPMTVFLDSFSPRRADISGHIPAKCSAKPEQEPFAGD